MGGASNRSIDFLRAKWGLQAKDGTWIANAPSQENEGNFNNSFWFGELGAGLLWFSVFDEESSFYFLHSYYFVSLCTCMAFLQVENQKDF